MIFANESILLPLDCYFFSPERMKDDSFASQVISAGIGTRNYLSYQKLLNLFLRRNEEGTFLWFLLSYFNK